MLICYTCNCDVIIKQYTLVLSFTKRVQYGKFTHHSINIMTVVYVTMELHNFKRHDYPIIRYITLPLHIGTSNLKILKLSSRLY